MRKVIVRSTDFWAARLIQESSLRFSYDAGSRVSTCSFETRKGASLPFPPSKYDYVEVTDPDGATVRWTGRIRQASRDRLLGVATNPGVWSIDAVDWSAELDRINVDTDQVFTAGWSDKYIVDTLTAGFWSQVATTGVTHVTRARRQNMPAYTITQGSRSLRAAYDEVAAIAFNAPWWVDPLKQLHWNDVLLLAPFVFDSAVKTGAVGQFRGYSRITDYTDYTGVAHRVTVIGTGGEDTVTDWPSLLAANARRSDERGAPSMRVMQLDDITDMGLTTSAQRQQRGFQEIAKVAPRRTLTVSTYDGGLYAGMSVDVIDRSAGTGTAPHAAVDTESLFVSSTPGNLHLGLGRFFVQRVTPQLRQDEKWLYDVELGAFEPTMEQALVAA